MSKPDYKVCVSLEVSSEKTIYRRVGSAWIFDKGTTTGISVKLDYPIAVTELVCFEIDDKSTEDTDSK